MGCLGACLKPVYWGIELAKIASLFVWEEIRPATINRLKITSRDVFRTKNMLLIAAVALTMFLILEKSGRINVFPENFKIEPWWTVNAELQGQIYEEKVLSAENYQSLPDWTRNDIQSANYTNALRRSLTNPMLSKAVETEEGVTTTVPRDEYSKEGALEVLKLFQNAGVPDVAQGLPYSSSQIFRNQAMLQSLQDFGNSQAVANSLPIQQTTEGNIKGAELWYEAQKLAQEFSEMIDSSQWVDGGTRAVFDIDKERHAHWQRVVDGIIENQRQIKIYVGSFSN
jgi:hypothetical protein